MLGAVLPEMFFRNPPKLSQMSQKSSQIFFANFLSSQILSKTQQNYVMYFKHA